MIKTVLAKINMNKINFRFYIQILFLFFVLCSVVTLTSCGGTDDEPLYLSEKTPIKHTGVFVDSHVEGLRYKTDSVAGITNASGEFEYFDGETITFYLEQIKLGETKAKSIVTPIDIVENASDESDPTVINLIRFIQTLDQDGDPENGINISSDLRTRLNNMTLIVDFSIMPDKFETDYYINALIDQLSKNGSIPWGQALRSEDEALQHFRKSLFGELQEIQISPTNAILANGRDQQFKAVGIFSKSTRDITRLVKWTSENINVATINDSKDNKGISTGKFIGTTLITATLDSVSGSSTLRVSNAELTKIEVYPVQATIPPSVPKGKIQQFTAIGTYSDNSTLDISDQVSWSTSDNAVATISEVSGNKCAVKTLSPGTITIICTLGSISADIEMTVTEAALSEIEIAPQTPSVKRGDTLEMTATGIYSDKTRQDITYKVIWESSSPQIATIRNSSEKKGVVTAVTKGTTTIYASLDDITASTTLKVTDDVLYSVYFIKTKDKN